MTKLYCTHNDCRATVILEIGEIAKKLNRPDLLEMAQSVPDAEVRCRHVARPPHTTTAPDAPLPALTEDV